MSSPPATLAARPGVAMGSYPTRRDGQPSAVARALHAAVGRACVPRRASGAELAAFAGAVEGEAVGLDRLDERGFDAAVAELRRALQRAGLGPAQAPRGFALVREAARRTLGTPHFDVQLFGGLVMIQQGLAELETGEGKTLMATLPASLAALAGTPVHVVTANDYLVERDATEMSPLYRRLGISVGSVVEAEGDPELRRAAYACDVTYVSNKQVAFDYLRDHLGGAGARPLASRFAQCGDERRGVLRGLCFAIVDEADSVLIDDARTPLILTRAGAPIDEETVRAALGIARSLEAETHYRVDHRRSEVEILAAGRTLLAGPGLAREGPLSGPRRREEWVQRALEALHLYVGDRHYLVRDGALQVIDLPTGRRAPDRAFEGEIQALIEATLGLPLTPTRETVARISYQRFFRRYLRLAGMTGTAREVARELWSVYGLRTVSVPTRLPSRRQDLGLRVFATEHAKWQAAVARIGELHRARRPVLVGTASVEASEHLSRLLSDAGISHQVLSARQDRDEARVVAGAGEAGCVTVATRMAGRGTDIRLGPGVADLGGLAVVSTELGEARRIDRQLFGRCARQGAPGSHEQLVSLEDPLVAARLPAWLRRALVAHAPPDPVQKGFTRRAQHAEEARGARARRLLLETEGGREDLLAFSGRGE